MTKYQEKLQKVRDEKNLDRERIELERQAEAERKADVKRQEKEAQVQKNIDKRIANQRRIAENQEQEKTEKERREVQIAEKQKQKRAGQKIKKAQIAVFQKFVDMVCRQRLDQIQNTGKFEISRALECGIFELTYSWCLQAWSNFNCDEMESANVPNLLQCATVWAKEEEKLHIENDPRVDKILIDTVKYPTHRFLITVSHGDPEEWVSNIPRKLEGRDHGGYRNACEGDIEYHQGPNHSPGTLKGWYSAQRRALDKSVSNFFLDHGFFGGR